MKLIRTPESLSKFLWADLLRFLIMWMLMHSAVRLPCAVGIRL